MNFSNSAYRPITERWQAPEYGGSECERLAKAKRLDGQLAQIAAEHKSVSFACSFSIEDIILVERITSLRLGIAIFAIDTGRLPGETLGFADEVEHHFNVSIQRVAPDSESLQRLAGLQHDDDIYLSESFRKQCCEIRKLVPLGRALAHADAWVTGMRREQSATRASIAYKEIDHARGIAKFNPLVEWSTAEVWSFARQHKIPIHPLHERGYPSIGCAPCTRAVRAHEDLRAGRWWWLSNDSKECGLHQ